MSKNDLKKWNRIDVDFITKLFVIAVCIIGVMICTMLIVTRGYEFIVTTNIKIDNARQINNELDKIYKLSDELGISLLRQQDLERKKKVYDPITEAMQREVIEMAHTKIAKAKVPYGTWVKLTETGQPLKVVGHIGLECITQEGVMFMSTEEETYEFISQWQYDTLKNWWKGDLE